MHVETWLPITGLGDAQGRILVKTFVFPRHGASLPARRARWRGPVRGRRRRARRGLGRSSSLPWFFPGQGDQGPGQLPRGRPSRASGNKTKDNSSHQAGHAEHESGYADSVPWPC